jgi:hypothetical protein
MTSIFLMLTTVVLLAISMHIFAKVAFNNPILWPKHNYSKKALQLEKSYKIFAAAILCLIMLAALFESIWTVILVDL